MIRNAISAATICLVAPRSEDGYERDLIQYDLGQATMAMMLAATVGAWGLYTHPVDMADPFLGLIEARSVHQRSTFEAGVQFARAEGILPALESSHAVAMASSLMSTPVTAAPSRARLSESPPELHCRWASVLPSSLPRRARSSGKRVTPPPRRKVVRSPRWLSCAPTTAFQERRFCSRRSV